MTFDQMVRMTIAYLKMARAFAGKPMGDYCEVRAEECKRAVRGWVDD